MPKYSKEFKIKIIHHYLTGNEGLSISLRLVVMVLVAMVILPLTTTLVLGGITLGHFAPTLTIDPKIPVLASKRSLDERYSAIARIRSCCASAKAD